jgi:hypothetical protein
MMNLLLSLMMTIMNQVLVAHNFLESPVLVGWFMARACPAKRLHASLGRLLQVHHVIILARDNLAAHLRSSVQFPIRQSYPPVQVRSAWQSKRTGMQQ